MKKTRWKLLRSIKDNQKKKPEDEYDWLEKVLGPREETVSFKMYRNRIFEEIIKKMSDEIGRDIDTEILKYLSKYQKGV